MSRLVIRALRCVEETDEIGTDDVYMALFRGSFTLPPTILVKGGKGSPWSDMESGSLRTVDMVLDDNYHKENVYVAALIEQDKGLDLADGSMWAAATEFWVNNWTRSTLRRRLRSLRLRSSAGRAFVTS